MINMTNSEVIMNYYTIKQTAEILNISLDRVRKKILQKKRKCFPGAVKPGHEWLLPMKEVIEEKEYMRKRMRKL